MTRTWFVLTTVLAVFVAGCQPDGNGDPIATDLIQTGQTLKAAPTGNGSISITALLRDPSGGFSSEVHVSGQVTYQFVFTDPASDSIVICDIAIGAELWPSYAARCGWTVSAQSHERFVLDSAGSATFDRSYNIQGRDDGVFLRAVYTASALTLELQSLSLEMISTQPHDKD